MNNQLYFGDNLDILRRYIADESVDLVYLDPPFNSAANYNVLFAEKDGTKAASQIEAFTDTWTWTQESETVYSEIVTGGGKASDCLQAFRTFLGECDLLAYLVMMAPRLVELRRVLKPTGSIYLHCDPTASHYLKMLMDAVFGADNFRNEIIWHYKRWPAKQKNFQRMHDVILFYAIVHRGNTFNTQLDSLSEGTLKRWKGKKSKVEFEGDVRLVTKMTDEDSSGRPLDDVWEIPVINSQARERLGYPTQKPVALLERIIKASSNEGDVVLDPFCGCGTTIDAAQKLGRRWIGIDITQLAITLIKKRLLDTYKADASYDVIGEPRSLSDAEVLAKSDPYQFQWWALGLVGARPVEQKKGADHGIDGKIIFQGETPGKFENVIISVKAGKTQVSHVRDLKGVLSRENAAIGVLISMQQPTAPMRIEAATSGFYESDKWGRKYPKVQLLTVADLLDGRAIEMPPIRQVDETFRRAARHQKDGATYQDIPGL